MLDVKSEVNYVAILNHIFFAFKAPFSGIFCTGFAVISDEIIIGNNFRADKAFGEVSVDDASCFRGFSADSNGPGAYFFNTDVEISCLPSDLPESIDVDMTDVEIDQIIHLSDLQLPKGVTLLAFAHGGDEHEHDLPVVAIHAPKVVVEEEEEGAPEAPEAPEATSQSDEDAGEDAGED